MNSRKVVIKNVFGSLKNKWRILRHFNLTVVRATIVIVACCVLHNYCFKWGAPKLNLPNVKAPQNNRQGFEDRLPILYIKITCLSVCPSVRAVSRHCPDLCLFVFFFFFFLGVLFSVSVKLPGPSFFFFLMDFVFCVS
jgi:hypothetical protein